MFEYVVDRKHVDEAFGYIGFYSSQGFRLHTCEPTGESRNWMFIVMERPAQQKGEESTPMPMKG